MHFSWKIGVGETYTKTSKTNFF